MTHNLFSSHHGDTIFESSTMPGEPIGLPTPRAEQMPPEIDPEVARALGKQLLDHGEISD